MRDPRFQVRSLTGYTGGHGGGAGRKPFTTFYVMDTAYCWEIVGKFNDKPTALFKAEALNLRWQYDLLAHARAREEPERKPRRGVSFRLWNERRHRERNGQ